MLEGRELGLSTSCLGVLLQLSLGGLGVVPSRRSFNESASRTDPDADLRGRLIGREVARELGLSAASAAVIGEGARA